MLSIWFRIMYCCISTPTTDRSAGIMSVTLNMPVNRQEIVREFHIVWRVVTLNKLLQTLPTLKIEFCASVVHIENKFYRDDD